ncbi:Anti-sigma F factor antagonist [Koleobacter methoxysyntrophicus]|uniref:Anti-sigma F factor antagonist n=1 Tax=Koleobacter methoxysyntrophicus TaxID=2751313 RepID=A0A8A0RP89_9FIRM|nr:anti-sigma F factor antagonist [Koleobacter methoxysyntrophicus]MDI3540933.1 hypothetical protein [Thermosediminibacterales bacterium]MDK2901630.1 hypothetical protein [Thermosediminibacterales bacterium]QSQ10083.1 Anti-sigma F factor antagonist [Koleobacter methoxysyntrophicus]
MEINIKNYGKTLYIAIKGELDHHNSENVRSLIREEMLKAPIINLLFDFNDLAFMDSSGVGMILGRYNEIKNNGGKIGVTNVGPQVKRIIEISGLKKVMKTFRSVKDAIKEFEGV